MLTGVPLTIMFVLALEPKDIPGGIAPDVTLADVKLLPGLVTLLEVFTVKLVVSVPLNDGVVAGAVTVIV